MDRIDAPPLDREASRADTSIIAAWRGDLDRNYRQLLRDADPSVPGDAEAIGAFENARRDDQEWASGYEAGRADAERKASGASMQSPGASWFGDGWSASLRRQSAYDLGLADGGA